MRLKLFTLVVAAALVASACQGGSEPAGPAPSELLAPAVEELPFYVSSTDPSVHAVECRSQGASLRSIGGAVADVPAGVTVDGDLVTLPAGEQGFSFTVGGRPVMVRCLPEDFPRIVVSGRFADWVTLATYPLADGIGSFLMVLDPTGFPAWFQRVDGSLSDFFVTGESFVRFSTEVRPHWGFNTQPGLGFFLTRPDGTVETSWVLDDPRYPVDQHAMALLPNGNALLLVYERTSGTFIPDDLTVIRGDTPEGVVGCPDYAGSDGVDAVRGRVLEVTPAGDVVHVWRVEEFLPGSPVASPFVNIAGPGNGVDCVLDPDHLNTVVFYQDPGAAPGIGRVMTMGRHNNAAILIDWPSGDVIWEFGGRESEHSLTVLGDPLGGLVTPHDAHFIADDLVLVYDNRQDEPSRAVIYRIDETARTATLVSSVEIPCPDGPCMGFAMGSARVSLDGRHLLVGVGTDTTTAAQFPWDGSTLRTEPSALLLVESSFSYRALPSPPLDVAALFAEQSELQSTARTASQ